MSTIGIATAPGFETPSPSLGNTPGPTRTLDMARDLSRILLCDGVDDNDALARLEAGLDEYVDVWTPALHATSRFEFVSTLAALDDAIGDVGVTFTDAAETPSITFLAWRASGRFVRPAFLDDDRLVEPNGAVVRVAGTTSLSFTSDRRVDQIRCYYDRLALIEQMLATLPLTRRE